VRLRFARLGNVRRARDERGAVLIIVVAAMVMAIFASALGVDIGRIAVDKRNDQAVADVAALDASRALGALTSTLPYATYQSAAQTEVAASALRNHFTRPDQQLVATVGSIDPTTNVFNPTGNSAVRVVATSILKHAFVNSSSNLTAKSVAYVHYIDGGGGGGNGAPTAAFSVGSTLISLDTSKSRLDPMLKTMLGASGSFSAVSYDGLASANLSIAKLQTALLAAGLNVGTPTQLLSTDIKITDLLHAAATALTSQGSNVAAAEVNDLLNTTIGSSLTVKLGQLLNVASPSDAAALSGQFNLYQLVVGSAEIANGANFVSVPLTGVNLGSLAGVSLAAKVISPATTAIGPVGTAAENTQIAMKVNVDVALGGLLPVAHVALTYTTAEAHGTLTSIVCGASPTVGISANASGIAVSGVATTTLGTMNIASSVAQTATTALSFNYPSEFGPTTTKHVGTASNGLSLASVTVTGSGATVALAPVLQAALPNVLVTLDVALQPLIRPLFASLGLDLSSVDVGALGIYPNPANCSGTPALAQ
jgi:uncharacterized membrane protein